MQFTQHEILETIRMTEMEHLDIRTVTMGINLRDCADSDINRVCEKVYSKIVRYAGQLVETVNQVGVDFIGGYSALVHKGFTRAEEIFLASIPEALATTERLCSSVNAATTRA